MTTDPSNDVFAINSRSGRKIVVCKDACTTKGTVLCRVCADEFDIRDNVGIIIDLKVEGDLYYISRSKVTCSHECSLYFIGEELKKGSRCDVVYRNAESNHRLIHSVQRPNAGPLIMSKDPSLLKVFGGSESYEEWRNGRSTLISHPCLIINDIKCLYSSIRN